MIRLTIYQLMPKYKFHNKTYNNIYTILFSYTFNNPFTLSAILQKVLNMYPNNKLLYNIFPCLGITYLNKFKMKLNDNWEKKKVSGSDKWEITNEPITNKQTYYKQFTCKGKKPITLQLTKEYNLYLPNY